MEIQKISETEANDYIVNFLTKSLFSENISIDRYIGSDGNVGYILTDYVMYHGEPTKRIKYFNQEGYLKYLKYILIGKGYNIHHIETKFRDGKITYEVYHFLVDKGYSRRRFR